MKTKRKAISIILCELDRIDAIERQSDDYLKPVPTGFRGLDKVISGFNHSDLIILGARPGMGKTSFALSIAGNAAMVSKKAVAFFSLEMSENQLASRILSIEAPIGISKLKSGHVNDDEWERIIKVADILSETNFYFDTTPNLTVGEIKTKLKRIKNIDFAVVDYLQLRPLTRKSGFYRV